MGTSNKLNNVTAYFCLSDRRRPSSQQKNLFAACIFLQFFGRTLPYNLKNVKLFAALLVECPNPKDASLRLDSHVVW